MVKAIKTGLMILMGLSLNAFALFGMLFIVPYMREFAQADLMAFAGLSLCGLGFVVVAIVNA